MRRCLGLTWVDGSSEGRGREAEQVREGSQGPDKGVLPAAEVSGREVELGDDDRDSKTWRKSGTRGSPAWRWSGERTGMKR